MLAQAYDSHSSIRRARREKSRAYRAATVSVRIGKQEAECRAALAIECPRERRQELDRLYDRKTFGEERARMHAAEASVLSGMGGFVSEHLGRAGKIFVASTRRAGKLESGPTKEWTGVRFAKKAMSLDDEYVEINKMMVRVLRLDLDVDYNLDHLENALRLEVGIGIPCLPHLVAGRIRGNVIERPHLIWLLTDAVCFSETARKGPQKLLSGVYKGMVSNLAPYGADGGAPMLGRVKNPLSRKMGVVLMNDSDFPSLADYAKVAWEGGSREEWLKSVLAARPGTDVERSNRAFDMTRAACFEVLRTRRNAGCARLRACVDHHDVEAILFEDVAETVSNRRCRRSVIRWVAETWIQSGQRERGRFADSLSGDGKERMSMGAVLSAAARRGETLSRVTDSYVRLGTQAPADAVASMAGVSRRTVYA